ncbi:flavin reductase family protein [Pseudorhodoferax sp. LjRoot39]|uniref:flavin reductase family protein n=1 Tax=Pseudorhodoferax sp. LjRoot39 TaxID=3342328 RepID=UPI003ECE6427
MNAPHLAAAVAAGVDPRALRNAFGQFATGITVVTTTDEDGAPVGLTANSFTSVSLDPPLVLFCLDRRSASLGRFMSVPSFGINVLGSAQQALSSRFASRHVEDRFAGIGWSLRSPGVPWLEGAVAHFACDTYGIHDAGDHLVFIGHVRHFETDAEREPLLYFQGRYHVLASPDAAASS